jgi:hypothetical protein
VEHVERRRRGECGDRAETTPGEECDDEHGEHHEQ